jgi:hypothetical protein
MTEAGLRRVIDPTADINAILVSFDSRAWPLAPAVLRFKKALNYAIVLYEDDWRLILRLAAEHCTNAPDYWNSVARDIVTKWSAGDKEYGTATTATVANQAMQEFIEKFDAHYPIKITDDVLQHLMNGYRGDRARRVVELFDEFNNHSARIQDTFDAAKAKLDWSTVCNEFLNRLPSKVSDKLFKQMTRTEVQAMGTLDKVFSKAAEIERKLGVESDSTIAQSDILHKLLEDNLRIGNTVIQMNEKMGKIEKQLMYYRGLAEKDRMREKPAGDPRVTFNQRPPCSYCGKPGHSEDYCFQKKEGKPPAAQQRFHTGAVDEDGSLGEGEVMENAQPVMSDTHYVVSDTPNSSVHVTTRAQEREQPRPATPARQPQQAPQQVRISPGLADEGRAPPLGRAPPAAPPVDREAGQSLLDLALNARIAVPMRTLLLANPALGRELGGVHGQASQQQRLIEGLADGTIFPTTAHDHTVFSMDTSMAAHTTCEVKILGEPAEAIIDTGSGQSFISERYYKSLLDRYPHLVVEEAQPPLSILTGQDARTMVYHRVPNVPIRFVTKDGQEVQFVFSLYVFPRASTYDILLGTAALKKCKITIDVSEDCLVIPTADGAFSVPLNMYRGGKKPADPHEPRLIPPPVNVQVHAIRTLEEDPNGTLQPTGGRFTREDTRPQGMVHDNTGVPQRDEIDPPYRQFHPRPDQGDALDRLAVFGVPYAHVKDWDRVSALRKPPFPDYMTHAYQRQWRWAGRLYPLRYPDYSLGPRALVPPGPEFRSQLRYRDITFALDQEVLPELLNKTVRELILDYYSLQQLIEATEAGMLNGRNTPSLLAASNPPQDPRWFMTVPRSEWWDASEALLQIGVDDIILRHERP